jgi:hypothetical protein
VAWEARTGPRQTQTCIDTPATARLRRHGTQREEEEGEEKDLFVFNDTTEGSRAQTWDEDSSDSHLAKTLNEMITNP